MLIHDTKRRVELAFSVSCQHRDKLIELAARHMMPAIYSFRMVPRCRWFDELRK